MLGTYSFLKTVTPAQYKLVGGYDIYVYDCYKPAALPEVGASMFFGLKNSVENSGFLASQEVIPDESTTLAWDTADDYFKNLYGEDGQGGGK